MVGRRTVEERRVIRISAVESTLSRELERHRVRPTRITNCPARQTVGRSGWEQRTTSEPREPWEPGSSHASRSQPVLHLRITRGAVENTDAQAISQTKGIYILGVEPKHQYYSKLAQ